MNDLLSAVGAAIGLCGSPEEGEYLADVIHRRFKWTRAQAEIIAMGMLETALWESDERVALKMYLLKLSSNYDQVAL